MGSDAILRCSRRCYTFSSYPFIDSIAHIHMHSLYTRDKIWCYFIDSDTYFSPALALGSSFNRYLCLFDTLWGLWLRTPLLLASMRNSLAYLCIWAPVLASTISPQSMDAFCWKCHHRRTSGMEGLSLLLALPAAGTGGCSCVLVLVRSAMQMLFAFVTSCVCI